MLFYIYAIPVLSLALVAWAVATPSPLRRTAARVDGRGHPARVRRRGRSSGQTASSAAVRSSTGGGRRLPRNGCWLRPTTSRRRSRRAPAAAATPDGTRRAGDRPTSRPLRQRPRTPHRPLRRPPSRELAARRRQRPRRGEPSGPAFADPSATASFAACGSRPTGPHRRRSRCGAGRSDRAGRPSRSTAISSTRRSSAVTTRSSPATTLTTGEPVWRHRDAVRFWESNGGAGPRGDADAQQRPRLHVRRDRNPERARRRHRRRGVVAQRGADTGTKVPDWGFSSSPLVVDDVVIVAAVRHARRLRRRHRQAALGRSDRRRRATARRICATIDGVAAGPAAERRRRDQRRAGRRHAALGARVGGRRASCSRR